MRLARLADGADARSDSRLMATVLIVTARIELQTEAIATSRCTRLSIAVPKGSAGEGIMAKAPPNVAPAGKSAASRIEKKMAVASFE